MTVSGIYRTSAPVRGNQSATATDEVVSAVVKCLTGIKAFRLTLPDAFTVTQLNALLTDPSGLPTVTGTRELVASNTAGWAAMSAGDRTAMVAAYLAKGYTLNP